MRSQFRRSQGLFTFSNLLPVCDGLMCAAGSCTPSNEQGINIYLIIRYIKRYIFKCDVFEVFVTDASSTTSAEEDMKDLSSANWKYTCFPVFVVLPPYLPYLESTFLQQITFVKTIVFTFNF